MNSNLECKVNNVFIHPSAIIYPGVTLNKNVRIGAYSIIYPNVEIRENTVISERCSIGFPCGDYYSNPDEHEFKKTVIGSDSIIRSDNVIYEDCHIGNNFNSGHHVTIREDSKIGNNCSVGTLSDIQGKVNIGNFVRMHSNVHIGQLSVIKDYVWIFPYVVLTNDMYPPMDRLEGCTVNEFAIVTTGSILLPGKEVGTNSLVAAGSVVSKDVPDYAVVRGVPARISGDVRDIKDDNNEHVYPWKKYLKEYRGYPWQK